MSWIRSGGKAALLPTKPAASGDAFASPQGRRNKMRLPCTAAGQGLQYSNRMLKMERVCITRGFPVRRGKRPATGVFSFPPMRAVCRPYKRFRPGTDFSSESATSLSRLVRFVQTFSPHCRDGCRPGCCGAHRLRLAGAGSVIACQPSAEKGAVGQYGRQGRF
jgi:hypothetical protein